MWLKERVSVRYTISQLKAGMRGIDLIATVKLKGKIKDVTTRFGHAQFCSAVIEDQTGKINLNLWRGQIYEAEVGLRISIVNGFVRSYGDALELNVGKDGNIRRIGETPKGNNI
jgi:ssDNA-binding replication factor A large subunit